MPFDPSAGHSMRGAGPEIGPPDIHILRDTQAAAPMGQPLTADQLFSMILEKSPSGWTAPHSSQILNRQSLDADLLMAKEAALELLCGLRELSVLKHPAICVYGGARMSREKEQHTGDVQLTYDAGKHIILKGFSVMNGGGPGAMHFASEGGHDTRLALGGGENVPLVMGVRIYLPFETTISPCLDRVVECKYFFTRKALMAKYSAGVVMAPGGMGSYDEFFEALAIAMFSKEPYPIALLGDFWKPLHHWLKENSEGPGKRGYIPARVLDLVQPFSTAEDAVSWIEAKSKERVARFYSHRENGNYGPLADEIVGDVNLLAKDPQWKLSDITMVWEALQDMQEMFRFLARNEVPLVSVVGGRSALPNDPYRILASELGTALADKELSPLVARADGLMLDAAYAARERGSFAFALDRARPGNPLPSRDFVDDTQVCFTDFTQELGLVKGTAGMVVLPGGVGTLRMFSEAQNLVMCGKLGVGENRYPLVLMGTRFFHPLREVLYEVADSRGYLTRKEIDTMLITDDPRQAARAIASSARAQQAYLSRQRRIPLPVIE